MVGWRLFQLQTTFFLTSIKDLKSTSVYLSSVWSDSVYLMNKKKNLFLVISAEILLFPKRVRRQIVRRVKVNKHQPLIK